MPQRHQWPQSDGALSLSFDEASPRRAFRSWPPTGKSSRNPVSIKRARFPQDCVVRNSLGAPAALRCSRSGGYWFECIRGERTALRQAGTPASSHRINLSQHGRTSHSAQAFPMKVVGPPGLTIRHAIYRTLYPVGRTISGARLLHHISPQEPRPVGPRPGGVLSGLMRLLWLPFPAGQVTSELLLRHDRTSG
jgi:hypothetical protein